MKRAFSLIELLVVLAIVAVLTAAAMVSFEAVFRRQRVLEQRAHAYGFVIDARAEAVRTRVPHLVTLSHQSATYGPAPDCLTASSSQAQDFPSLDMNGTVCFDRNGESSADAPVLLEMKPDLPPLTVYKVGIVRFH